MKDRIDPHKSLAGEIRRIVADEISRATADLETARTKPEKGFHETRKRLKKLRALFRLVRSADRAFWSAENIRLRDVARDLAGAREAAALVETVDRLAKEYPKETNGGGLAPIRAALVRRHDRIVAGRTGLDTLIDAAIQANLRETTTRVLATLTPREERVLRMRFGIGMNTDHTLEEVGQQFSVTRERIRQIEAKALRKLKHPSRSRKLRSFLDN